MIFLERINEESLQVYHREGWELPYIKYKNPLTGEDSTMVDYKTMRKNTSYR